MSYGYEEIRKLKAKRLDAIKDVKKATRKLAGLERRLETAERAQSFQTRYIEGEISQQYDEIGGPKNAVREIESIMLTDAWVEKPAK